MKIANKTISIGMQLLPNPRQADIHNTHTYAHASEQRRQILVCGISHTRQSDNSHSCTRPVHAHDRRRRRLLLTKCQFVFRFKNAPEASKYILKRVAATNNGSEKK
jgi:hypothetical protein